MGRPAVRRALWRFDRGAAVDGARRAQPKGACGVGPDRRPGLRQHWNSWAFNNRCAAYNAQKNFSLAITYCDQAIRLDPKGASAFNNRGTAYYDKKDYDRAIADYTEAIRLEFKVALSSTTPAPLYRARRRCLPDPRARVLLP